MLLPLPCNECRGQEPQPRLLDRRTSRIARVARQTEVRGADLPEPRVRREHRLLAALVFLLTRLEPGHDLAAEELEALPDVLVGAPRYAGVLVYYMMPGSPRRTRSAKTVAVRLARICDWKPCRSCWMIARSSYLPTRGDRDMRRSDEAHASP